MIDNTNYKEYQRIGLPYYPITIYTARNCFLTEELPPELKEELKPFLIENKEEFDNFLENMVYCSIDGFCQKCYNCTSDSNDCEYMQSSIKV